MGPLDEGSIYLTKSLVKGSVHYCDDRLPCRCSRASVGSYWTAWEGASRRSSRWCTPAAKRTRRTARRRSERGARRHCGRRFAGSTNLATPSNLHHSQDGADEHSRQRSVHQYPGDDLTLHRHPTAEEQRSLIANCVGDCEHLNQPRLRNAV